MSRHRKPHPPPASRVPDPPVADTHEQARGKLGRPASRVPDPPVADTAALLALHAEIEQLRDDLNARLDSLAQAVERLLPPVEASAQSLEAAPSPWRAVRVGQRVQVPRLGGVYTVVEIAASGQTLTVQAGAMRVRVRRDDMRTHDEGPPSPMAPSAGVDQATPRQPDLIAHIAELDLHGFSEQEALITLDMFLHHVYTQRVQRVRVIHGKGAGILRAAVRQELASHPLVRAVDTGPEYRGDDGVTLADLDI